ncbi:hypothetical protein PHJA_000309800 [Phtheirospermum japonicum]|uniref:Uncharacterized protein n=1 Tax=Phtheirospermum japonicum TaxID=374723 RepID=A0A830BCD6_9LAMI|nr:hypothetical protein PHJA_000309800 [Phtheirospermum japonicum]
MYVYIWGNRSWFHHSHLSRLGEINRLPLDAAVSPPPKKPWSIVAIKNHLDNDINNLPIIFPPINHKNLHILTEKVLQIHVDNQPQLFSDSDLDPDSNSSTSFSPSDSSPSPPSPLIPVSDLTKGSAFDAPGWFDSWMKILCAKVRLFCSSFISSRGVFLTFHSVAFTAVLMAFLYFQRRRRLRDAEESKGRLIGIIKERDEKINQLLDQISRMNQVLLAFQRVQTSSTP